MPGVASAGESTEIGPCERSPLAELAFGETADRREPARSRHLAFMPADTPLLDLKDPDQRHFGGYELLELLGSGGTGTVYRARQAALDREVALKLLAAGPWASREFIRRFEHEARYAARMEHPNIVTVYDVGCHEEIHFYSMRLVRGRSLSARLRSGEHFSPEAAARLVRTVAGALEYAHGMGVLHLDLKPSNVLVDANGVPHVSDFGLARQLQGTPVIDNDELSGTPTYMAPEQAVVHAYKLSAATDVWALGAILYELVAGRPPFRGDSVGETLDMVLEGHVREPSRFAPALPRDLEAIICKCLYKDAVQRYQTARALHEDLTRFLEGRLVHARRLNLLQRGLHWMLR
ncbi:MAG: serine/threonine protein kinase [Rhodanobacteraceae bacterium]|nr:MAG: serine/threonine protein kinase [Rhodanobacteraceae bacterium]